MAYQGLLAFKIDQATFIWVKVHRELIRRKRVPNVEKGDFYSKGVYYILGLRLISYWAQNAFFMPKTVTLGS